MVKDFSIDSILGLKSTNESSSFNEQNSRSSSKSFSIDNILSSSNSASSNGSTSLREISPPKSLCCLNTSVSTSPTLSLADDFWNILKVASPSISIICTSSEIFFSSSFSIPPLYSMAYSNPYHCKPSLLTFNGREVFAKLFDKLSPRIEINESAKDLTLRSRSYVSENENPLEGHLKVWRCGICEKSYNSPTSLHVHERCHFKPFKCELCDKTFSRNWLLEGHRRTHTGEKPFRCTFCQRTFADRSNMRAHMQTHEKVKRCKCSKCPRSFTRRSLLIRHMERCCDPKVTYFA
ncbi:unnamed protein product [Hymenolepis diminuta]|uniref:Protein krueppel n=1 Tax=Hymenolepis diminuta TaxID=6216 RepID=A0A0R3SR65_HYMDI|nr:unnamed protein product [Hymenolepis diminuta]